MIWNTAYANPYAQSYAHQQPTPAEETPDIERPIEPILPLRGIGQSVSEGGRQGHLIQGATAAIRTGTGKIELQTGMGGGGEPVGAGSYGREAREALREMAEAAEVDFTSVHAPVQMPNLSGFNPQQGFLDEQRKQGVEEVKRAVDFAKDVTGGGAVVVHTGEFQRPISEQKWARNPDGSYKFLGFQEEPGRAITYMVDDRTGRIISDVRKSQVIREPLYKEAEQDYEGEGLEGNKVKIHRGDWVDQYGRYIDPKKTDDLFKRVPVWNEQKTRFETRKLGWKEIEERTDWYNEHNPERELSPEEMAFRIQMQTQMLQYRGSSLFHGQRYDINLKQREALLRALDYYKKLEKEVPKEEAWKIMHRDNPLRHQKGGELVPDEQKLPSQILQESLEQLEKEMQFTHESSASADAQADAIEDTIGHVQPVSTYAKQQSMRSYAEAGIHAMQQSKDAKKPLFVAPENIFPETGFGGHPEELIELVKSAREEMVKQLSSPKIKDPHGRFDKDGNLMDVDNPNYVKGMTEKQAMKAAEEHIKATLDTQHLGMWRAHFVPKPGETKEHTDKRFRKWYLNQIEMLEKENILGHIHLVDSLGTGHHALPAGQGNLPLKEALKYLKKKGFKGTIISEGWEEDRFEEGRIMTEAWAMTGSPVYSHFMGRFGPRNWPEMHHHWYGTPRPPFYIFGAYSPSNEWVLWSEVPME